MSSFAGIDIVRVGDDTKADYGKWLVHGPQGAGKTTLISSLAGCGKQLFIDLIGEHGTQSFHGAPWAKNIEVIRPKTVKDFDDIFWALHSGKHDYTSVAVDSLTAVQKMTMRYLLKHDETAVREIEQGVAPADIRTWGQALDIMTDFATFWYSLADATREKPMHVAMAAQTKIIDNEDTGTRVRSIDVQKGALSIVKAAPAYILYCDIIENEDAFGDDSQPKGKHIVRFGADPEYSTKARVPMDLRGKIPPILGMKKPTNLTELSRVLRIGGVPALPSKAAGGTEKKES